MLSALAWRARARGRRWENERNIYDRALIAEYMEAKEIENRKYQEAMDEYAEGEREWDALPEEEKQRLLKLYG